MSDRKEAIENIEKLRKRAKETVKQAKKLAKQLENEASTRESEIKPECANVECRNIYAPANHECLKCSQFMCEQCILHPAKGGLNLNPSAAGGVGSVSGVGEAIAICLLCMACLMIGEGICACYEKCYNKCCYRQICVNCNKNCNKKFC